MYLRQCLSLPTSTSAVFTAAVQATEEAIVNAMVAAETVIGASGFRVAEMPEDAVRALFRHSAD